MEETETIRKMLTDLRQDVHNVLDEEVQVLINKVITLFEEIIEEVKL